jgi:CBS domain-containing protein
LIGWSLVALGSAFTFFTGDFSGLWISVLGLFIQSSARMNVQTQRITKRLEDLTAGDSLKISGSVAGNLPYSTYQEEFVKGDLATQHLVLWQDEVVGVITGIDGSNVPATTWGFYQVRQLMTPLDTQLPSVQESTPLLQVVEQFTENPKLVVRSLEGKVVGIISPETVRRALAAS